MATELVDFAGIDAALSATTSAGSEIAEDTTTETPVEGAETTTTETTTDSEINEDGTPKTEEQKAAAKAEAEKAALPGDKTTPENIRKALKALRDSSPENAAAVKTLHGAFERWNAAKQIFPKGVAEMKDAKAFIDLVGGAEGYEALNQNIEAVKASDELLYSGDPKLIEQIVQDLKSEGKIDALGKLTPALLNTLKKEDAPGYYSAFAPHFLDGLKEVNMEGAIGGLLEALTLPEGATPEVIAAALAKAKGVAGGMDKWLKGLQATADKSKTEELSPERKKLDEERAAFKQEQEKFKTEASKKVQTEIAGECDKYNNKALGTALKDYLKMPFFKGFPRETLIDLGNGIKSRLFDTLKADKTYQSQMKAFWSGKAPDRGKITEYHNAKLDAIAADIVRQTVQQRYPGYAKGGSAAGRIAATAAKKETTAKNDAASVASGTPVYVVSRPKDLIRDDTVINGKQYTAKDLVMLQIAGKGYVKTPDGKGHKFITWRR